MQNLQPEQAQTLLQLTLASSGPPSVVRLGEYGAAILGNQTVTVKL